MFRYVLVVCFLLICGCKDVDGRENLARGRSYTLSPKPNYRHCTDAGDAVQLTDGRSTGSVWTRKGTVGWTKVGSAAEIVVDLGRKCAISEVAVQTIGGGFASVNYPQYVAVLVSDGGGRFGFAGLAMGASVEELSRSGSAKRSRKVRVQNLNAAGRYVKVLLRPGGIFTFADEVEVFGDASDGVSTGRLRKDLEQFSDKSDLLVRIEDYFQVRDNIAETRKVITANRTKLGSGLVDKSLAELDETAKLVALPADRMYSQEELDEIDARVLEVRAAIYRRMHEREFVCVAANPMEMAFEKRMVLGKPIDRMELNLWQNEYESGAFEVVNCTEGPLSVSVSMSPLAGPNGEVVSSAETYTVRRAINVQAHLKAKRIGSIADALVLQEDRPFKLRSGEAAQIWFTVHNPEMTAGEYGGRVAVVAEKAGGERLGIETFEIRLDVGSERIGDEVALNSCVWAYPDLSETTRNALEETAKDLAAHYVNTFVVHPTEIPWPVKGVGSGANIDPGALKKFYDVIDRHKDHTRTFLLYVQFRFDWPKAYFGPTMNKSWERKFSQWLEKLVVLMKNKGIGYDGFALYPYDERLGDEFYRIARIVKDVDPRIQIYANRIGDGPAEFRRFKGLIDIWAPWVKHCSEHPGWLEQIRNYGRSLWTYHTEGPGRGNDPYSYYRLLPWLAFSRGQTGAGFWVYVDPRTEEAWHDTASVQSHWSVVYKAGLCPIPTATEDILPSRRWEAWREGVEDYEYLSRLKKLIEKEQQRAPSEAREARRVLSFELDRVLKNGTDSKVVNQARRNINKAVLRLQGLEDRF